jgi:hypothetical protein
MNATAPVINPEWLVVKVTGGTLYVSKNKETGVDKVELAVFNGRKGYNHHRRAMERGVI